MLQVRCEMSGITCGGANSDRCGKIGHIARNCNMGGGGGGGGYGGGGGGYGGGQGGYGGGQGGYGGGGGGMRGQTCYTCGGYGHLSRDCTQGQKCYNCEASTNSITTHRTLTLP